MSFMSSSSLFKWVHLIRKFCLLGIKTQGWGRRREGIRIPNYNNSEFLENSKLFPTPEPSHTLFPLPGTLFFSIIGSSFQTDPLWPSYKSRLSPLLSSITKSSLFFLFTCISSLFPPIESISTIGDETGQSTIVWLGKYSIFFKPK